ncbi:hypothetical protein FHW68_000914 [Pseudomonas sp. Tn43]|nr:hypothetical protein [Pseudomonas sp. Tn43]
MRGWRGRRRLPGGEKVTERSVTALYLAYDGE